MAEAAPQVVSAVDADKAMREASGTLLKYAYSQGKWMGILKPRKVQWDIGYLSESLYHGIRFSTVQHVVGWCMDFLQFMGYKCYSTLEEVTAILNQNVVGNELEKVEALIPSTNGLAKLAIAEAEWIYSLQYAHGDNKGHRPKYYVSLSPVVTVAQEQITKFNKTMSNEKGQSYMRASKETRGERNVAKKLMFSPSSNGSDTHMTPKNDTLTAHSQQKNAK